MYIIYRDIILKFLLQKILLSLTNFNNHKVPLFDLLIISFLAQIKSK